MKIILMLALCAIVGGTANAAQGSKKSTKSSADTAPAAAPAPVSKPSMHDQYSGGGYGVAGCGLGSIVFGPKKGLVQIAAAVVNATGVQTFGITSGTSNCDIPEMGHQAAVFIEANKEVVRKEASRGQGETVRTIANMLNCHGENQLGSEMKSNYEQYFGNNVDSYETVRRIINSDTCSAKG